MENFIDMILSLRRNELDPDMRESHAELCQRAITFIQDATDFIVKARQVRSVSLTEQWEASKTDFRKQRAVVEQAVMNAGAIEAQLPAQHKVYGEARLAVQSYSPEAAYDKYASAEALAEVQVHREGLEAAVKAAAEDLRRLEQQIILSKGWASFESEKLNELASAEEALRIQIELAANPNQRQHNTYGLQTNQPEPVGIYDVGLTASQ
jgi:hypothetical protein